MALIDPRRGEVWRVDLEPTRGAEMQKTRPAIVLSRAGVGRLPLRLIVPLTGWDERFAGSAWLVRVDPAAGSGLTKPSAADAFQVRGAALERFGDRLGTLPDEAVTRIVEAVALTIGHRPPVAPASPLTPSAAEGESGNGARQTRAEDQQP